MQEMGCHLLEGLQQRCRCMGPVSEGAPAPPAGSATLRHVGGPRSPPSQVVGERRHGAVAAAAVSASCWRRSYSVWASAMLPPVSEDMAAAGAMRGRLCGERAVARAGRWTKPRTAR